MTKETHQEFLTSYKIIHDAFVRYCSSKAFGIMEAEDLVQEAILATLKRFDQIKDKDKLLSYLIGTVQNILRNKRRQLRFKGSWDDQLLEKIESKAPSPEIALDIHYLLKEVAKLPEKQQEALILFEISGFSIREISELQHSSEAATKTRLSRARQILRKRLSDQVGKNSFSSTLAAYASILL